MDPPETDPDDEFMSLLAVLEEKVEKLGLITKKNKEKIDALKRSEKSVGSKFEQQKTITRAFLNEKFPSWEQNSPFDPVNQEIAQVLADNAILRYWISQYRAALETLSLRHVEKVSERREEQTREQFSMREKLRDAKSTARTMKVRSSRLKELYKLMLAYCIKLSESEDSRTKEVENILEGLMEENEELRDAISKAAECTSSSYLREGDLKMLNE